LLFSGIAMHSSSTSSTSNGSSDKMPRPPSETSITLIASRDWSPAITSARHLTGTRTLARESLLIDMRIPVVDSNSNQGNASEVTM